MKQKYGKDGSIHVEFNYKGIDYVEDFKSKEELNQFLASLQEAKILKFRKYNHLYGKIDGAEQTVFSKIISFIKRFLN